MTVRHTLRATVCAAVLAAAAMAAPAQAQDRTPSATGENAPEGNAPENAGDGSILVTAKQTRSATAIPASEIQKILPGVSPLKAIQTLPGVLYVTADPWGNNEQNAQIFIHGFAGNQLGYTMDGIPLGDQSYGNYNGLSPQRAVISENVGRVVVATGAGDLATASNSNLGGTVETYSSDPTQAFGVTANQTAGSYNTSRTFLRLDTGNLGGGGTNAGYVSVARQKAKAWDFNGWQGGWQANAKFVHDDAVGKLTLYFDYNDMTQPNEDATVFFKPSAGGTATPVQLYTPYTKPFFYSDFNGYRSYINALGNSPAAQGGNYRNYYSDAQRTDYLTYARYDARIADNVTLSNSIYFHHNDGAGVVAGPLGQSITTAQPYLDPNYASLPANCRFGANGNGVRPAACTALTDAQAAARGAALVAATGGSGMITRTTEYRIDRGGAITALNMDLGDHQIELGGWFEHNSTTQWRRWYAVPAGNPGLSTPYIRPLEVMQPLFTQYQGEARINQLQLHVQDTWRVFEPLLVQFGFKTSAQWANGWYPVQPRLGSLSGLTGGLPVGKINTLKWFLPAVGATWDFNGHEEAYFNVQKNLRQYQAYLAGGGGPWFTGSQTAFNAFANDGKPESSWTYEAGLRTHRTFGGGIGLDAQINYYRVDFSDRLLAISTNPGGIAGGQIAGGTSILVNVGDVRTNGVDAAFTLRFGRTFSFYNATSYNLSKYRSDYSSAATGIGGATNSCIGGFLVVGGVVPTCGKQLPGTPKWMNKSVATLNVGPVEAQLVGDYVGKRFATYSNDASVGSYFLTSLSVGVDLPAEMLGMKKAKLSLNITNLGDIKGVSTLSVGSATNNYSAYPIPPRQWFLTYSAGF
ncbi:MULTISPECIES: TonB-dependent receptor [Sphingomonas]|nr:MULTISPECIES: TonB-dependent receptor plug domain-containing protein [Sphingomonas]MBN8811143.1 TonB-dependent receptor plug domain-containing protein [Sphingomonas sp.]OJY54771.1 MAG: TonB-dependent receptor [Sphingomonas sp. 67-41]